MRKIAVKQKGEAFEKAAAEEVDNRPELQEKLETLFKTNGIQCRTYRRAGGTIEVNVYPRNYMDLDEFTGLLKQTETIVGRKARIRLKVAHSTVSVVLIL